MARMFLVDGSNYAFRAHFALPPRHTSDGFPTRVLYGLVLLIQKIRNTWDADYVVFSFDKGPTFRNELYPEYKGHRPEMPEDLRQQWPIFDELIEAFGYRSIAVPGYEADDVLGTLAKRFASDDLEVYLVTSDKDFCQIVDDNIKILNDQKGEVTDYAGVIERWGVAPDRIVDILALCGDSSDNIPGVSKVGEKTAVKLIGEWGSLDGVLAAAQAGKIKGASGQRLVEEADAARLSYKLATIETAVPIDDPLDALAPREMDVATLRALFDRWEFGSIARQLLPAQQTVQRGEVVRVATLEALKPVLKRVRAGELSAVAFAPEDPAALSPRAMGVAFASDQGDVAWVDLGDDAVRAAVDAVLADPAVAKIGHGIKPWYRSRLGAHVPPAAPVQGSLFAAPPTSSAIAATHLDGVTGDTRLLDYVVAAHRKNHELADQASRYLDHTLGMDARGKEGDEARAAKAIEEAMVTARLHAYLTPKMTEGQAWVYRNVELPLMPVLAEMEAVGIRLDVSRIDAVDAVMARRLGEVEAECHRIAGKAFNLRSRHELRDVLFEDLKLTPSKKVKDGWSTDSDVLEKLAEEHPLPAAVLEYRALDKLRGTYLTKLPTYIAGDGRIHTTFQQEVAATGRLSSIDPNLQNIPVRTEEGRRIRACFVPAPGYVFLSADYSQIELRVLADFTKDPILLAGFASGEDIHRRTAVEVFKVDPDKVTLAQRSAAKAINFGLIYGMSAFRLGNDLQIPQAQAQAYMDEYFARMPAVRGWIEETKVAVRKLGYVDTMFGRRRIIPEIHSAQYTERMAAEREAVNTRIQGTAADLIKLAMLRVHAALANTGARMLLQVHDELLLEVPEGEVEATARRVVAEMQAAGSLAVPLVVNTSVGKDWQEAHG